MKANSNTPREVRQLLDQALSVEELIDILQQFDGDAKVVFGSDYGDITHTMQATAVTSCEELGSLSSTLVESAYSNSGVAIEEGEDDEQVEYEVIVLS
jgi:hypothetical protein